MNNTTLTYLKLFVTFALLFTGELVTAQDSPKQWMYVWSTYENADGQDVFVGTYVQEIDQSHLADEEIVECFRQYFQERDIELEPSTIVIASLETSEKAKDHKQNNIDRYAPRDEHVLDSDFSNVDLNIQETCEP